MYASPWRYRYVFSGRLRLQLVSKCRTTSLYALLMKRLKQLSIVCTERAIDSLFLWYGWCRPTTPVTLSAGASWSPPFVGNTHLMESYLSQWPVWSWTTRVFLELITWLGLQIVQDSDLRVFVNCRIPGPEAHNCIWIQTGSQVILQLLFNEMARCFDPWATVDC